MDLTTLAQETRALIIEILEKSTVQAGQIFVLGLSSSEVLGGHIGQDSSIEIGETLGGGA